MGSGRVRRRQRGASVVALALVTAVATAPPAFADTPEPDWFTEADPVAVTSSTGRIRDFERIGDRVFIAGDHTTLRDFVAGPDIGPAYLGAIDREGGQVITSFQPELDGEVRALARSADGTKLYVAGRFKTVNGEDWPNFVVLDPITGQRISDVRVTGGGVDDVQVGDDGRVYIGGAFTRINGVTRRRIGAFSAATGGTSSWSPPDPLDTVRTIAISPDGDRIYYGGGFTDRLASEYRGFLYAAHADDGDMVGSFDPSVEGAEVFDIAVHEDRVYMAGGGLGGLAKAFRTDGSTRARWRADGDVQVVSIVGNRVIFGGHYIEHFGSNGTKVIASLETGDLEYDDDVWFDLRGAQGAWAIHHDDDFLWIGGDINDARPRSVRGFARFTAKSADDTPPTRPGKPVVTATGADELTISWQPSTDDTYLVEYDVYKNGGKWRTVSAPIVVDRSVNPDTRYEYFVVAVDRTDKESSPSLMGSGWSAPDVDTEIIGGDDGWRYLDTDVAPSSTWINPGFNHSSWAWGRQILGFGEGDETTVVASGPSGDRHITTYFRRNFAVPTDTDTFALELDIEFDDGVVVYLNSTEVARSNMTSGTVTHDTKARDSVDKLKRSFDLDPGLLRPGQKNVLAVEVHQSSSGSSDLRLTASLKASMVQPEVLMPAKSFWTYDDDGVGDAGWRNLGFDDSGWDTGRAAFGTGGNSKTQVADVTTVYLRNVFNSGDIDRYENLRLKFRDNDGYIIRLNGIVIASVGLPPPPIRANTEATRSAPNHGNVTYILPADFVQEGENLLTVELHRYQGTGSVYFDASLRALP